MAAHTFYEIRRRAFAALVPPERRRTGEFQAANGRFPPDSASQIATRQWPVWVMTG